MSKNTDDALNQVNELISELSTPDIMTPEEAREFYADLIDSVGTMLEAMG